MSDDYTPTTDHVREVFSSRPGCSYPKQQVMFNRWLAAHDAEIRTAALEEAAGIAENRRPEIGANVLETPYRSGLYYGGTRTAEAIRAAKDGAQ